MGLASNDQGSEPDVVVAAAGDVPTLEALAGTALLRNEFTDLKIRFINVVDLFKLQPGTEHPHGMSDRDFDGLFTLDKPIIFNFHAYPWMIHRLAYRRGNHANLHVRGSLGASVLQGSHLLLHPLAFAGWLGLIVTALNLLPIGQLDGGHISHALFGSRGARSISVVAMISLFLLALFVWPGLMFWAFIVFFIAGTRDAPAANDLTPVGAPRTLLGYFTFLILLLIIVPVPHSLFQAMGLHCPYL